MKRLLRILFLSVALLATVSCHELPDYDNSARTNFDLLWQILDEHYCFFEEKNVDWNEVYDRYSPRVDTCRNYVDFFDVCSEMLGELRDGHVNLSSSFNTFYYRKWWSDYPQNYDERLVQQYYLNFEYRSTGAIDYGVVGGRVGYMRYPSFEYGIGEGNLDAVLTYLANCDGLIIDVRDNGGGNISNIETLVARFIDNRTLAGYISHKTGPGHDQFSEPRAFYYEPAAGRSKWTKPVAVLTNRSTYSAANNFVAVMKHLPQVYIVGATTGGGSGMPFSSELPCGWAVRFSACPVLDAAGASTEAGVSPSEGCEVDLDPVAALSGRDTMLDKAIELLIKK